MSGIEALTVISIIANIMQLVDFTDKVIGRVKDYSQGDRGIPRAFRDMQTALPLIGITLREVETQVSKGRIAEDRCNVLRPVLKECESKLRDLAAIFKKVMREQGESKFQKVFSSLKQDKKVAEIAQALFLFLQSLTYYHVASAPTLDDIAALLESAPRLNVNATTTAPKMHHLVPVQSSEGFVGRKEVLADLESKLCLPEKHCRVALVGLGGIGPLTELQTRSKTRIALQFARRYRKSTKMSVFWVHARSFERTKKAYEEIAKAVGISGYNDSGANVLQSVKSWFEDELSGRWLLIIDNADDNELLYPKSPSSVRLADYFPRSENGSILLTTRFSTIGHRFAQTDQVVSLPALTTNESKSLLKARLGPSSLFSTRYKELAKLLERFPLALVQAASFISVNNISVEKYLELYRQSDSARIQLLSEDFEDEARDHQSKNPVATTWSISFEYINKYESKAAELLSFMSMFDSQAIPESVVPVGTDSIAFEKALGTLQAFSFITVRRPNLQRPQDRCFDFHRLVRLTMRNWLHINGTFDTWMSTAVRNLAALRKSAKPNDLGSQFVPHAVQFLAAIPFEPPDSLPQVFVGQKLEEDCSANTETCPECTSTLLIYLSQKFEAAENFEMAKAYAQRDMVIKKHFLGLSDKSTLKGLERLVILSMEMSEFDKSEKSCRDLIKTSQSELGEGNVLTLRSLALLIAIFRRKQKLAEAETLRHQLLESCEKSIDQTNSLNNLERLTIAAQTYYDSHDYYNAAALQARAVQGYVKNVGVARSVTLTAMTRLVDIYLYLDRYDEAETCGRLALDTSKVHRGIKHPETISLMSTLSRILRRQSKLSDAKSVATEALGLAEEVFGKASPTYIRRLANFERDFGEEEEGEGNGADLGNGLEAPRNIAEHSGNSYSLRALRHFKKQDSFSYDGVKHLPSSSAGGMLGIGPRPTSFLS